MTSLISNLFYFFLACLFIVFVGVSSFEFYYEKPGPSDREQLLIINKGQSVENIASHLIDLNLIENRMAFMLVVRLKGFHNNIKFGQYMIPRSASIKQITDKLVAGVSVQHTIVIPEGMSTSSILDLINKDLRIKGDLLNAVEEGVLAPNTYSFDITTNKRDLFLKMKNKQKQIIDTAWNNRSPDLPLKNSLELLILASIVEKEAGNEEDKKKVASVFLNRLEKKNEITI